MAGEARIELVGRLGADPELRFTPSGAAVASVNVAVQGRKKNGDQWEDGETTWFRVTVWRQYAENLAESLRKGDRVVVTGTVELRKYQNREGGEGVSLDVNADTITPDLRFAQVQVRRVERSQGGGQQGDAWDDGGQQRGGGQRQQGNQGNQYRGGNQGGGQRGNAPADDPWGSAPQQGGWSGGGQQQFTDEPPF